MHDHEIKISDEEKKILSYFETHSRQEKDEEQHEPHD